MKMATKSAQTGDSGGNLDEVKQRFALWHVERKRGEHITAAMWTAAVGLVERHGLQSIARELRVDYGGLKRRFERGGVPPPARKAHGEVQFVELLVPPTSTTAATPALACVVETHSVRGATMRIELQSLDGLAELTRAFWSVR